MKFLLIAMILTPQSGVLVHKTTEFNTATDCSIAKGVTELKLQERNVDRQVKMECVPQLEVQTFKFNEIILPKK